MNKAKYKSYVLDVAKQNSDLSWALYQTLDDGSRSLVAAGNDKGYTSTSVIKAIDADYESEDADADGDKAE